jgi:hypothetical protein
MTPEEKNEQDAYMREVAKALKTALPGMGFALLVFPFDSPGTANYISNGRREDMIKAMKETVARLEAGFELRENQKQ